MFRVRTQAEAQKRLKRRLKRRREKAAKQEKAGAAAGEPEPQVRMAGWTELTGGQDCYATRSAVPRCV